MNYLRFVELMKWRIVIIVSIAPPRNVGRPGNCMRQFNTDASGLQKICGQVAPFDVAQKGEYSTG